MLIKKVLDSVRVKIFSSKATKATTDSDDIESPAVSQGNQFCDSETNYSKATKTKRLRQLTVELLIQTPPKSG